MKIYQFFNYRADDALPEKDYWLNFKNPDSTKLAFFCAESWRRNGWDVERMSTHGVKGFEPFTGQLADSQQLYALEFFNFWFKARDLAPAWFLTIDVFNYGFAPQRAGWCVAEMERERKWAVTVQAQHFSGSLLYARPEFCDMVIDLVKRYDAGELPKLISDLVSDETVARHYAKDRYLHVPIARYALVEEGWEKAPLIHCPRSVLQWFK